MFLSRHAAACLFVTYVNCLEHIQAHFSSAAKVLRYGTRGSSITSTLGASGGNGGSRRGPGEGHAPLPPEAWQYNAHQFNISYELVNLSFFITENGHIW